MARKITTIRLSDEDRAYADAIVDEMGLSRMADAIRLAIRDLAKRELSGEQFQRISETRRKTP